MAALDAAPHLALDAGGTSTIIQGKLEEPDHSSSNWYFPREEIERNSPSGVDGIDSKKETYFRKSYCTFLQDLGMRLKVPQVTIATAITFCHRFFLRQSHARNDRFMIATVCMFLAGKVEETPRPLRDVILVSYEIRNKKDPAAAQRIKQKDVYEAQKELVLYGERLVLTTLGFDLNVHHPYKPLVAAIKKFKVAQHALAQVAWNFVNDGLRTSLCLQFKPHHIAAGAIFLAAKFLKVKLPVDGEKLWWQEFDVTPRQLEGLYSLSPFFFSPLFCFPQSFSAVCCLLLLLLLRCQSILSFSALFSRCSVFVYLGTKLKVLETVVAEVSNQMLELYEQNKLAPPSRSDPQPPQLQPQQQPQQQQQQQQVEEIKKYERNGDSAVVANGHAGNEGSRRASSAAAAADNNNNNNTSSSGEWCQQQRKESNQQQQQQQQSGSGGSGNGNGKKRLASEREDEKGAEESGGSEADERDRSRWPPPLLQPPPSSSSSAAAAAAAAAAGEMKKKETTTTSADGKKWTSRSSYERGSGRTESSGGEDGELNGGGGGGYRHHEYQREKERESTERERERERERGERERERGRGKEREWQERDTKKVRYDRDRGK